MFKTLMIAAFSIFVFSGVANSANLEIPEIPAAPKLDGLLDDPVWKQAATIDTFYGKDGQASRDTTLYLARDKKWLYVGARCANPGMQHVAQQIYDHEGAVSMDDSLELFLRPSTANGAYFHFLLNFANVGKEQRCDKASPGMRDVGWNPPWQTITQRLPDGWTAEMAIPLYCLETEDLSGMSLNACRSSMTIELDNMGAKRDEKRIVYTLSPGNKLHDFAGFQPLGGMGGFKPELPFALQIRKATIGGLRQENNRNFYEVKLKLESATAVSGKARLSVMEEFGKGYVETLSREIELDGMSEITLAVPVVSFGERAVKIVLSDPANGNLLASRAISDTSALNVIKKAFVGRSYYTTEETAELRLELGLPEAMLGRAALTIDLNGEKVSEVKGLHPAMTPTLPTSKLKIGENQVTVHAMLDGKELASRTLTMTRLEARPGYEVQADFIKGVLLKDKRPFFPVGIDAQTLQYQLDVNGRGDNDESLFKYLSENIGLNTVVRHAMSKNIPAFMNLAEKYGLNVINWASPQPRPIGMVPGQWPPPPVTLPLDERLKIQRTAYEKLEPGQIEETKLFRDCRNFIGYWNVDEPNLLNPEERIAAAEWYYKTVEKIDTYHPQFLLYSKHIPNGDNWTRWGQILGYDVYPAPPYFGNDFNTEPGLCTAYYAWELRERCRKDNKLMWFVPLSNSLDPARTPIGLSKTHMRCQAYAAIVYGARGLLYFTLNGVVGPDAWDGLREIAAQVKEMTPALANGNIAQNIKYTPDDFRPQERKFPMVNAAAFKYPDGDYLLMAVNVMPYAVNTKFQVGGLQRGLRLFDADAKVAERFDWLVGSSNELSLDGKMFTEKIEPYGTRAYRLKLSGDPVPLEVSVNMTPVPNEIATTVDVLSIIRQLTLGKNHMPNPCFSRQTNKGIPDFFKPYFCLGMDTATGQKGSDWYVDDATPWNGRPSLRMLYRSPAEKCRGTFASFYPPVSVKPLKMTFSFYARSENPKATLWIRIGNNKPETVPLNTEWTRHHITFDLPPEVPTCWGARSILLIPSKDAPVWINGLQMEEGEQPTEFSDDSVSIKKKVTDEPGNLIKNGHAEYGDTSFWSGLDKMSKGSTGIRKGTGHGGEYAFEWKGQSSQIKSDPVEVDTGKAYELKGFFKSEGEVKTSIIFGLVMLDAEKRKIMSWNRSSVKGTRTELVAPSSPDGNVLKVKDATAWKQGASYAVSFGKEENALNFDVSPLDVTSVQKEGDYWKIVLKKPCGMAFPAGTQVVENTAGNNGIFLDGAVNAVIPGEWTELKGIVGPKQWWPGTKYISVTVIPKSDGNKGILLMDDISLKINP